MHGAIHHSYPAVGPGCGKMDLFFRTVIATLWNAPNTGLCYEQGWEEGDPQDTHRLAPRDGQAQGSLVGSATQTPSTTTRDTKAQAPWGPWRDRPAPSNDLPPHRGAGLRVIRALL